MVNRPIDKTYFKQVHLLTLANLKVRYRKSIFGFIWVILNPLILFGAQSIVFKYYFKLPIPNYSVFLLTGLVPWIFMVQSLEMCSTLLTRSGKILKSYPVHPSVYILSQIIDNFVNFVLAFFFILIPIWVSDSEHFFAHFMGLFLIPIPFLFIFITMFCFSWIVSMMQVFYKDTSYVVPFFMQVMFFLTPVFYPVEMVPPEYKILIIFNPFYRLIDPFRHSIFLFDLGAFAVSCFYAAICSIVAGVLVFVIWRTKRNSLYRYL